jgi:hypothetical protein
MPEGEAGRDDTVKTFAWTPPRYRKLSVWLSIGIHLYLYLGMVGLIYLLHGERWILGWKPIVLTVVSTIVFARFAYTWIMRLDAQYGRGSGWTLARRTVKLPELAQRARKPERP